MLKLPDMTSRVTYLSLWLLENKSFEISKDLSQYKPNTYNYKLADHLNIFPLYVASLRFGGEEKTYSDHILVIGDAAGKNTYIHCICGLSLTVLLYVCHCNQNSNTLTLIVRTNILSLMEAFSMCIYSSFATLLFTNPKYSKIRIFHCEQ